MKLTDAILSRRTCRAFKSTPVSRDVVEDILTKALRAPSGGNLQPWRVYVVAGSVKDALIEGVKRGAPEDQGAEYEVYPPNLKEPYRTRRYAIGEELYKLVNVPREDKEARLKWFARNWEFFGAPIGMIFTMDRIMQEGQWADLGMFMQNIMLLAREHGLHTAAQEAWSAWTPLVVRTLNIPDNEMVFCGMALGYEDTSHPMNQLRSSRVPLNDVATFHGF